MVAFVNFFNKREMMMMVMMRRMLPLVSRRDSRADGQTERRQRQAILRFPLWTRLA